MNPISLRDTVLGYPIDAQITRLDDSLHVLLTGGSRTHVGAISWAIPGNAVETVQFPVHRDGVVSERWAANLCEKFQCPVVVNCGIHYDHATKADIMEILHSTDWLLEQALQLLGKAP